MHPPRKLVKFGLYLSLPTIVAFLIWARPPIPYYALPLAPIALAALLYEFIGGTLAALAAIMGVGVLMALDPDPIRRAITLQDALPILVMYLAVGPMVGWLTTRERERERKLISAARRLHVVQEINQAVNSSLALNETIRTILIETHRLVDFDRAAVILRSGDRLQVVATKEDHRNLETPSDLTFSIQGTATGWVIENQRYWKGMGGDIQRHPDTRQLCLDKETCLIVPLLFLRSAIGAFLLSGQNLSEVDEADLTNLNQIAGQMAIAIQHAHLFELEQRRAQQFAAISEAGREIAAALDLERTLGLVVSKAAETLPLDAAALMQLDADTRTYQVVVSHNVSTRHVDQINFAFDEGVPGWVVKNRKPLVILDAGDDKRVHPAVVEDGVKSVLSFPLVAREQVVGILNLYSKTERDAFDQNAVRLGQVFADQAAIAIENARLVEELKRSAVELEARVERRTRQLRESQAQVIRTEKLAVVGRLAASVAHEVNNPLQAITLQLQLILDEKLPETVGTRLSIVQQEMARIADIVQRLLDFQRPTPGDRSPQDVRALLDDVLALAGKQLQENEVVVTRQDPDDLPKVEVDAGQLKQVFLNLVLNAADALETGGELTIYTSQENGELVISFSDTGMGIPAEEKAYLFEPFFSTKPDGSGLGLAVSHEIVSAHDGRLEVDSIPGEGSTFKVRLPILGEKEKVI